MTNKAIGKLTPNKNILNAAFEVATIERSTFYGRPEYEGINTEGTKYHVFEEHWTLELYEITNSWDGKGLPPVGTECEYMVRQAANQFWQTCTVIASGKENLIADVNGEEVVFFAPQIDFRPRRNEAERKREEVGVALFYAINWNHQDGPVSESRMEDYRKAYDAIAAGKIPRITLKYAYWICAVARACSGLTRMTRERYS